MRAPLIRLGCLLSLLIAPSAGAYTIDNFEDGDFTAYNDSVGGTGGLANSAQAGLNTSGVMGGVREVAVYYPNGSADTNAIAHASLSTTSGDDSVELTNANLDNSRAAFQFTYDGMSTADNETTGNLHVNLTGIPSIDVTASSLVAGATVSLDLWSSTATQSTGFVPLVDGPNAISLDSFTIDMSDIRTIRITISDVSPANVVNMTSITTVPEPTTGLLVSAGLLGLAGWRRARAW
jgi:hypothetical protein